MPSRARSMWRAAKPVSTPDKILQCDSVRWPGLFGSSAGGAQAAVELNWLDQTAGTQGRPRPPEFVLIYLSQNLPLVLIGVCDYNYYLRHDARSSPETQLNDWRVTLLVTKPII